MKRIPEPELMDDPEQARAYALADFSEPHQAFIDHFARCFPRHRPRRVLDLGCGPADVTIRFARAYPDCVITSYSIHYTKLYETAPLRFSAV